MGVGGSHTSPTTLAMTTRLRWPSIASDAPTWSSVQVAVLPIVRIGAEWRCWRRQRTLARRSLFDHSTSVPFQLLLK